ncbi:hypothetical protein ACFP7A_01365 [Sporolactobacillus kofuensis]|uniref:Uncharacterized protein n=1 Tax=Sporolactobacillus kofuensis TaxID=269672 RepID=A0ABW1WDR6_9BACL|nr:hypothetical protein [Sporolactobacillus kofuensis]MCO7177045.1 hypothetical protein [Sporolactobacillus kofuensis]
MRNYPFMQDMTAQRLLVEHGGSIGYDGRGRPVFKFRDSRSYETFIEAFQESKKTTA